MKPKFLLWALFLAHIFFMFYNLEKWAPFGWDQVDNAWAAMRILALHNYPLVGMVAKQNTGIYIGPLYYYLVAIFYFLTHLDPIAGPLLASVTSIASFFVLYVVTKELCNRNVAFIALGLYTFSSFTIVNERTQWPVNFIAPLSLLILYFLHKVLSGNPKYFLFLAIAIGVSFHIHFTAIFYPIIVLAALPFVPWNIKTLRYLIFSVGLGLVFFLPQSIYYMKSGHSSVFGSYAQTTYHGFHLTRMFQLLPDAFIKFQSILMTPYGFVRYISFLFIPIFIFFHRKKLSYLVALWFIVPWITFTTYSGEISDYYFSLESYVAIMVLAYLSWRLWEVKNIVVKIFIVAFWSYWIVANVQQFFHMSVGNLPEARRLGQEAANTARIIPFTEGDPTSYLYYYYMYRKGGWLPYKL